MWVLCSRAPWSVWGSFSSKPFLGLGCGGGYGAQKSFKPLQEQSKLSKFRSMKYLRMRMIEISEPRNLHFGEVTICLWKQAIGLNESIRGTWRIHHHL